MELGLLLALTTSRFKGHLDCSVCDKRQLSRLDWHLANIHDISGKELTQMLIMAKEECFILEAGRPLGPPSPPTDTHQSNPALSKPEDQPEALTSAPGPSHKGRTPKVSRQFTKSMVCKVLENFQEFHTSFEPTNKNRENARLHKSHATWFVLHMHQKCPSSQFMNLKFLYDFQQIRQ
ncbi:hypothetical protein MHYP_G00047850 [Metynnis hypsauchen]